MKLCDQLSAAGHENEAELLKKYLHTGRYGEALFLIEQGFDRLPEELRQDFLLLFNRFPMQKKGEGKSPLTSLQDLNELAESMGKGIHSLKNEE